MGPLRAGDTREVPQPALRAGRPVPQQAAERSRGWRGDFAEIVIPRSARLSLSPSRGSWRALLSRRARRGTTLTSAGASSCSISTKRRGSVQREASWPTRCLAPRTSTEHQPPLQPAPARHTPPQPAAHLCAQRAGARCARRGHPRDSRARVRPGAGRLRVLEPLPGDTAGSDRQRPLRAHRRRLLHGPAPRGQHVPARAGARRGARPQLTGYAPHQGGFEVARPHGQSASQRSFELLAQRKRHIFPPSSVGRARPGRELRELQPPPFVASAGCQPRRTRPSRADRCRACCRDADLNATSNQ
eukprot:scaffold91223_cov69-Phaeocystis_antarctica.AAC.5